MSNPHAYFRNQTSDESTLSRCLQQAPELYPRGNNSLDLAKVAVRMYAKNYLSVPDHLKLQLGLEFTRANVVEHIGLFMAIPREFRLALIDSALRVDPGVYQSLPEDERGTDTEEWRNRLSDIEWIRYKAIPMCLRDSREDPAWAEMLAIRAMDADAHKNYKYVPQRIRELTRPLTIHEAKELPSELDNGNFGVALAQWALRGHYENYKLIPTCLHDLNEGAKLACTAVALDTSNYAEVPMHIRELTRAMTQAEYDALPNNGGCNPNCYGRYMARQVYNRDLSTYRWFPPYFRDEPGHEEESEVMAYEAVQGDHSNYEFVPQRIRELERPMEEYEPHIQLYPSGSSYGMALAMQAYLPYGPNFQFIPNDLKLQIEDREGLIRRDPMVYRFLHPDDLLRVEPRVVGNLLQHAPAMYAYVPVAFRTRERAIQAMKAPESWELLSLNMYTAGKVDGFRLQDPDFIEALQAHVADREGVPEAFEEWFYYYFHTAMSIIMPERFHAIHNEYVLFHDTLVKKKHFSQDLLDMAWRHVHPKPPLYLEA